jgi:hypothetical protein
MCFPRPFRPQASAAGLPPGLGHRPLAVGADVRGPLPFSPPPASAPGRQRPQPLPLGTAEIAEALDGDGHDEYEQASKGYDEAAFLKKACHVLQEIHVDYPRCFRLTLAKLQDVVFLIIFHKVASQPVAAPNGASLRHRKMILDTKLFKLW